MKIYHGYEIVGLENIPKEKPALLIMYHSAATSDILYTTVYIYLKLNRKLKLVADRCLFNVPILKYVYEASQATPGKVDELVDFFSKDHLVMILPGGLYEAAFSDENYTLLWGQRKGFARVAALAKVPIIPLFTQNCRAMVKTLDFGKKWWHKLYEKYKICLRFWIGCYPVKLRCIIGKPIEFDENRSIDDLVDLTKERLSELIKSHQRRPDCIISAQLERFVSSEKADRIARFLKKSLFKIE